LDLETCLPLKLGQPARVCCASSLIVTCTGWVWVRVGVGLKVGVRAGVRARVRARVGAEARVRVKVRVSGFGLGMVARHLEIMEAVEGDDLVVGLG
jgi:hypothetical protein